MKIGNSRGIRIPKPILDQTGLDGEIDVEVHQDHLVIRPAGAPREGWDEAFRAMAERTDDALIDEEMAPGTSWDREEWEWR